MDIFKQKRYLVLVIILLVILNLSTLLMLWLDRPQQPVRQERPEKSRQEEAQTVLSLRDELGFSDVQSEQFSRLRRDHREQMQHLNDEIRQIKMKMFEEVLKDDPRPALSDSLLKLAQEKQIEIEQLTFQYLLDLKELCNPEQQKKLRLLIDELFRRPPERKDDSRPPPPPRDEGGPRRPAENN